jgi:hypothetical protein
MVMTIPTLIPPRPYLKYPEARSAVANTDDPEIPSSTFRAWVVGLIWTILISGVNQSFEFRYPSVWIYPARIRRLLKRFCSSSSKSFKQIRSQIANFPVCRAWARSMPNISLFGISLNPGPFTIKEHVTIVVMANVSSQSAYAVGAKSANYVHAVTVFLTPLLG